MLILVLLCEQIMSQNVISKTEIILKQYFQDFIVDFVAFDHILKQLCKKQNKATSTSMQHCYNLIILFQHCVPTGEISCVKVLDKNVMNTFYKLS